MKIIHGFCRDKRKSIVNNIKTLVFIAVDGIALLVVFVDVYTIISFDLFKSYFNMGLMA